MRTVKDLKDVQIVLNELLDWKTKLSTQNQDFHKLKITNAAPATDQNDYVILSQLPTVTPPQSQRDHHYTIVLSKDGTPSDGDVTPPFRVAKERAGIPTQVWISAIVAPTDDAFFMVQRNGVDILPVNLKLPKTVTDVLSSQLVSPVPNFAASDKITAKVITASGVSQVSIGIVVKRTFSDTVQNS